MSNGSFEHEPSLPQPSSGESLSEHEGFLDAIAEAPDDDSPKLIYADWLEEHNDPRGELIRLELVLQNASAEEKRRPAWETRRQELYDTMEPVDRVVFLANTELLPSYGIEVPENAPLPDNVSKILRAFPTLSVARSSCPYCTLACT